MPIRSIPLYILAVEGLCACSVAAEAAIIMATGITDGTSTSSQVQDQIH